MPSRETSPQTPIAIVGVGCRFPKADDAEGFWSNIVQGRVAFSEIPKTRWNHEVFYSALQRDIDKAWTASGSFIDDVKVREFAALHYGIAPRRLEVMDPQQRLLIEATRWALQDAGFEKRDFDRSRTGVYVGFSTAEFRNISQARMLAMQITSGDFGAAAGTQELRDALLEMTSNVVPTRAFSLAGSLGALAAASVSQTFDLGGPAYTVDAACASALVAVHDAIGQLRSRLIDYAIAGGAYLNLTPENLICFTRIGAISPSGVCRPFDSRADGFVQSDGIGMVVLRRLEDALRDGDRIYAVVRGTGCNNDGRGDGPMSPRVSGQLAALKMAYADAGFSPASVAYFEAHGTATNIGDPVEVTALGTLLTEAGVERTAPALIGSVKGNIGHAMSAAGIAGLVKAIKVLEHREAPPQAGFEKPNPTLELERWPLRVVKEREPLESRQGHPLRVSVSSFGFGGTNAHLVLEAPESVESAERSVRVRRPMRVVVRKDESATAHRAHPSAHNADARADASADASNAVGAVRVSQDDAPRPEALLVSAPNRTLLIRHLTQIAERIESGHLDEASLADLAYTLNCRRKLERVRAVVGAKAATHCVANLRALASALESARDDFGLLAASPHALAYDLTEQRRPKVAFLFPGQGAQRVGLLAAFRDRFPVFRRALDTFDAAVEGVLPAPLSAYLYPEDFGEANAERRRELEDALTATEVCQPAMAALGLATAKLLESANVVADVSLGHSLGEFTALANAGVLEPEDAVRFVAARGCAMRDLALEDRGTMAAAMASAEAVEKAIAGIEGVVIANVNHPTQTAISGTTEGVARASEQLGKAGIEVRPLSVSHAFHSPLLEPVEARVEVLQKTLRVASPKHLAASCISPKAHTDDLDAIRRVMLDHATARVDFVRGLFQAKEAGAEVFVQVGAGSTLTAFARATLQEKAIVVTLSPTDNDGGYEFIRGLAMLAALGVPVNFEAIYAGEGRRVITLPETPLEREIYWAVREEPQPKAVLDYPFPTNGTQRLVVLPDKERVSNDNTPKEPSGAQPDGSMLLLFQQQAEILRSHAEIIAAQNRLLLGGAAPDSPTALPQTPQPLAAGMAEAKASAKANVDANVDAHIDANANTVVVSEPTPISGEASQAKRDVMPSQGAPVGRIHSGQAAENSNVRDKVFEIVARISAFPRPSLRPEQRLIDELGFDSLMVTDLGGAIEKAFPASGGVPASLFKLDTTVGDLVRHLEGPTAGNKERAGADGPKDDAPRAATPENAAALGQISAGEAFEEVLETPTLVPRSPVAIYRAVPKAMKPSGLPTRSVEGETWLVVEDGSALSSALSSGLEKRGARLARVRFVKDNVAPPDRINFGGINLWPDAFIDDLPALLSSSEIQVRGLIFAAALASSPEELFYPVLELHPLVAKLTPAVLATITGLGGKMGLAKNASLSRNVLQSSLAGYTKALARERPSDLIRTIDIDPAEDAEKLAPMILDEVLAKTRDTEVGLSQGARYVAELVREELSREQEARRKISNSDVILITGGAGEIGRLVAEDLASDHPRGIVLVGRRPEDDGIRALITSIEKQGAPARYLSCDATSTSGLREGLAAIVKEWGPVSVAIHAAGILEDARAPNKTYESIERVMDVKVRGLQALVGACPKLKDIVLFTSWAGRFGNAGQTDYSAANDLLDHIAISGVGAARTLAIAWPPWSNTKMVKSIPDVLRNAMESGGVTFLEDEEGVSLFRSAFEGMMRGAVVVGRDLPAREVHVRDEVRFDLEAHPYLQDHRLKGEPVVPLASATDLVASTYAAVAQGSGALIIDGLELLAGLRGGDVAEVSVTGKHREGRDQVRAEVRIVTKDGSRTSYRASLTTGKEELTALPLDGKKSEASLPLNLFYRDHTFHGPMLRGIESISEMTDRGIRGRIYTSKIRDWMPRSSRDRWIVDPLVVDGSFQLAAYWLHVHHQKAGYPIGFDRLVLLRPFADGPITATVILRSLSSDTFQGDIWYEDDRGQAFGLLTGVRGRVADVLPATTEAEAQVEPAASTMASTMASTIASPKKEGNGANGASTLATLPDESFKIAAFPELIQLDQRFQMAELIGLRNPYFHVHAGTAKNVSVVDGVEMLNYSSYNYLGFSGHPEVVAAAQESIAKYGTSVSASRVASGERPLHQQLERGLAEHIGVDDAIVFVSGHATNVTTIGHLFNEEDLIVHDSLIHDSILQGIKLSRATRRPYPHGDLAALARVMEQVRGNYRRALICAEGIYSMDGDICDLPRLIEIKQASKALLLIDEAHSIGVLGPAGRGIGHHFTNVDPQDVDIWMGTLSKSFASCGGYIAGSKDLIRFLKYTAPGFVYSAGITPPNAASALRSLELMKKHPEVVERLRQRSKLFLDLAKARGIDTGLAAGAAVIPAIIGNSMDCMKLSERLAERKINVQPIVYPAVEDNASRLRFFLSALHTEEQIHHTVEVLAEEIQKVRKTSGATENTTSA